MADTIYCEHGRTSSGCEDCAYARAVEAGLPVNPVPPAETRARAEQAASDERARLDEAQAVQVKADQALFGGETVKVHQARGALRDGVAWLHRCAR